MRWMSVFILLSITCNLFGQKFLQLEKYGSAKVRKFYIGEEITYRVDGDKTWYTGTINDLLVDDNIILFENRAVTLDRIVQLKTFDNAQWSKQISLQLYTAAASWVLFSAAATLVGWWELTASTWIIAGAAVVTAWIIRQIFKSKKIKLGKRKWLRMLDITVSPPFGP